jgi:uncharacterized protein (DUF885 family)
MSRVSLRAFLAAVTILVLTSSDVGVVGQSRTVGEFFDDFSAEWMRRRPSQSTASRYFTGAEQDRLDRQLTPQTPEWRRETIEQARRGLRELARFDRSRLSDAERVSADVMQWQLQIIVDGEPFSDYDFPLDQFDGTNVRLPNLLTGHPSSRSRIPSSAGRVQLPATPHRRSTDRGRASFRCRCDRPA